jgi:hypothetical protein
VLVRLADRRQHARQPQLSGLPAVAGRTDARAPLVGDHIAKVDSIAGHTLVDMKAQARAALDRRAS